MAAEITRQTGLPVDLVSGARGELSVRVDKHIVAKKTAAGFPSPQACAAAVQHALGRDA